MAAFSITVHLEAEPQSYDQVDCGAGGWIGLEYPGRLHGECLGGCNRRCHCVGRSGISGRGKAEVSRRRAVRLDPGRGARGDSAGSNLPAHRI